MIGGPQFAGRNPVWIKTLLASKSMPYRGPYASDLFLAFRFLATIGIWPVSPSSSFCIVANAVLRLIEDIFIDIYDIAKPLKNACEISATHVCNLLGSRRAVDIVLRTLLFWNLQTGSFISQC